MSKGKDFRPRRRGFDDDEPMDFGGRPNRPARQPMPDDFPQPSMGGMAPPPSGDAIEATVKWFKGDKGFGFVELAGGQGDAFLHIGALQTAGYETVPPGAKLKVIAGRGLKGMQVSRVLEVDTSSAQPARPARSFDSPRPPRFQPDASSAVEIGGTVKWFDATKGFGFIAGNDGGKDIFVHVSTLRNAGLTQLTENQSVMVKVIETPKGREALEVREG